MKEWNHIDEIDDNIIHLTNDEDSSYILISKADVLSAHEPKKVSTGMYRTGWDDYDEKLIWVEPKDSWKEEKYQMVSDVLDRINYVEIKDGLIPWECQKSNNPQIQVLINAGFWINEIIGDTIFCEFYGIGNTEPFPLKGLPKLYKLENLGSNRIKLIFEIINK